MVEISFDIETTGLHPWQGDRVTAITAVNVDDYSIVFKGFTDNLRVEDEADIDSNEADLIRDFLLELERTFSKHGDLHLVTKNGRKFDINFLMARYSLLFNDSNGNIKNGYYPILINDEVGHSDLHDITSKWVSLDDMARMYNLPLKTGSGKGAIQLWKDHEFADLVSYCLNDSILTAKVYKQYKALGGNVERL